MMKPYASGPAGDGHVCEAIRMSFESRMTMAMDYKTTGLTGIVWLPDGRAKAPVALTNVGKQAILLPQSRWRHGRKASHPQRPGDALGRCQRLVRGSQRRLLALTASKTSYGGFSRTESRSKLT